MNLISTLVIPPKPMEKPFYYLSSLSSHHPILLVQIAKEMGIEYAPTSIYKDLASVGCTIIITFDRDTLISFLSDEFTFYQLTIMKRLRRFILAFPILDVSPWSRTDLHVYSKSDISQKNLLNKLYSDLTEYQKNTKRLQFKK